MQPHCAAVLSACADLCSAPALWLPTIITLQATQQKQNTRVCQHQHMRLQQAATRRSVGTACSLTHAAAAILLVQPDCQAPHGMLSCKLFLQADTRWS
jgi:hypothetical protein